MKIHNLVLVELCLILCYIGQMYGERIKLHKGRRHKHKFQTHNNAPTSMVSVDCINDIRDKTKLCECHRKLKTKPAVLTKMIVDSIIEANLVQTTVELRFQNKNNFTIEAIFTYPIKITTAVYSVTATINGEELVGEIKKKGEAKKMYQDALHNNQAAILLELESNDMLKLAVGNIHANANVTIIIKYIDDLPYRATKDDSFKYKYFFPTNLFPRGNDEATNKSNGRRKRRSLQRRVARKSNGKIHGNNNCVIEIADPGYSMDFQLTVKESDSFTSIPGINPHPFHLGKSFRNVISKEKNIEKGASTSSNSHKYYFKRSKYVFRKGVDILIELKKQNKDWEGFPKKTIIETKFEKNPFNVAGKNNFIGRSAISVHPNSIEDIQVNEYIFIIDCSGSMMTDYRIDRARDTLSYLLKTLKKGSFFNIIKFGTKSQAF